jgi:integrase
LPRTSKFLLRTDRQVLSAPPPAGGKDRAQYRIKGAPGLVLRVTPSGAKSWGLWLRDPRTRRWRMVTIGTYPRMTLANACAEWKSRGGDPEELAQSRCPTTVRSLGETYITRYARPNKRSWRDDEAGLARDFYPKLGELRPSEITRLDVVELLNDIYDRGLNWAVSEGYLDTNPAQGVARRAKEEPRTRVLNAGELASLWCSLDSGTFEEATADVFRLQLLIGARIREVTGMARDELDLSGAIPIWTLPRARAKGGRDVVRPLPPLALRIVSRRMGALELGAQFLFPSAVDETKPLTARAPTHALRRAVASGKVDRTALPFTPHDFRRTCRTSLAELGVAETVAKKILGHAPPRSDVTASVYDQHAYLPEMYAALLAWERRLLTIVAASQRRAA